MLNVCFTVVVIGYCQANSSPTSARKLGTASVVFSVVSGILGLLIVIVVIGIYGDLFVPELIAVIKVRNSIAVHTSDTHDTRTDRRSDGRTKLVINIKMII